MGPKNWSFTICEPVGRGRTPCTTHHDGLELRHARSRRLSIQVGWNLMFDFRKTKGTFVGSWFSDVSFFTTQVTRKDVPFLCPFLCFLFLFPFYVNVSMLCNVVLFPFHGFFFAFWCSASLKKSLFIWSSTVLMWTNFTSTATFSPERYRNHVKEMLTQIISSAEAEMSLDLGPHPMQKNAGRLSSQRERPLVNHDTTPPMQSSGRMKLCVHLVIWMNLAQEVSDMTVQKTSARTFCHEKQNFYDWLIFPY